MIATIIGAILIGLTLGLMGSGGSILTLPVLVYVLAHDPSVAVVETMAIVGLIAMATSVLAASQKSVCWRSVLLFGIPGMAGTVAGAWIGFHFFEDTAKLIFTSVVMLLAAWSMLRNKTKRDSLHEGVKRSPELANFRITLEGVIVGIVTGIVGAGGGFLVVPALVLLGRLSMKMAVGTSLVIVTMKCLVGFAEYQYEFSQSGQQVDWSTIAVFAVVGIVASFVGRAIGNIVDQNKLKKGFGWFLVVLALFILGKEISASI